MNQPLRNLLKYKDLLFELIKKDIKIKYKNSYIGILWSLINPLLMMIVLTIIFSELFKSAIPHFPVYVLTGRLVYSMFSEATNQALDSVYNNGHLIRKVYVPKYFFPLTKTFSTFIMNLIILIPIFAAMGVLGVHFSLKNLLVVVPLLLLFFISLGAGLLLSTIGVFFRDLKHLYSVVLFVVMYATPIFYPASIIPSKYHFLIEMNPLFSIVNMVRDSLLFNEALAITDIWVATVYAAIFLLVGTCVFFWKQDRFIYYL